MTERLVKGDAVYEIQITVGDTNIRVLTTTPQYVEDDYGNIEPASPVGYVALESDEL